VIPEQQELLHKAQDSIRGAKALMRETLFGFAASRAYYAMFYVAQALLLQQKLSFSKHSAVIAAFGKHFAKTGIIPYEFHQYLNDAQNDRLAGDYDTVAYIGEEKALLDIQRAEAFIDLAEEYLNQSQP
jgi:uncharacterized protein (UPF0332 family)